MRLHTFTVLICALVRVTAPCSAQQYATDRGVWLLGGTARFTNSRDIGRQASTRVFEVNPSLGYFVVPGFALTANLEYAHFSGDGGTGSVYGIGPGLTYYFRHRAAAVNPFLSGSTLYTHQGSGLSRTSFTWVISGGAAFFLARNVAIIGELFYNHRHLSADPGGLNQSNSSEEYGIRFGVSVYVF